LTGKHAQAACYDCHANARSRVDLRNQPQACASCHQVDDAHGGRFGTDCGSCHSSDGWQPAKFDHNLSVFPLVDEHAGAACEDCHQNGIYKGTPTDCYSCHAQDDEHGGRFGTECASCHTPNGWEDAAFDHNLSNFPLTGAHASVNCEKCHTSGQFAGTLTACVNCHQDPAFHVGAFGAGCESCHSTAAWSPASYNGSHPGIADEGGFGINHGGTTCKTCHPANVYTYTCLACHSDNFGGEGEEDDD
jgi:mono/diheme cytochrome c family protein